MDNLKTIKKILSEKFGIPEENIEKEAHLLSDLNLSNLEINDLVGIIAHEFKLSFGENDTISPQTVSDLLDIIEEYSEEL